jgi:uncharacterized DUF497 family protein
MNVTAEGFDWDAGNRHKCQKRGISVAEIESFLLSDPWVAPDPKHSVREEQGTAAAAPCSSCSRCDKRMASASSGR